MTVEEIKNLIIRRLIVNTNGGFDEMNLSKVLRSYEDRDILKWAFNMTEKEITDLQVKGHDKG